jgi:hypothetical protein
MKSNLRKVTVFLTIVCMTMMGATTATAQTNVKRKSAKVASQKEPSQIVEASCGQCKFGLTGTKGCDLAVRIDGKAYFVDGVDIHQFGDAHGDRGFCNAVRKAEVQGEVVDGRFKAKKFKLKD